MHFLHPGGLLLTLNSKSSKSDSKSSKSKKRGNYQYVLAIKMTSSIRSLFPCGQIQPDSGNIYSSKKNYISGGYRNESKEFALGL